GGSRGGNGAQRSVLAPWCCNAADLSRLPRHCNAAYRDSSRTTLRKPTAGWEPSTTSKWPRLLPGVPVDPAFHYGDPRGECKGAGADGHAGRKGGGPSGPQGLRSTRPKAW